MPETEKQIEPESVSESKIFNVSVRAIITLGVVATVCVMSLYEITIKEPLYTLAGMVIGYYFAQKEKPKNQQNL